MDLSAFGYIRSYSRSLVPLGLYACCYYSGHAVNVGVSTVFPQVFFPLQSLQEVATHINGILGQFTCSFRRCILCNSAKLTLNLRGKESGFIDAVLCAPLFQYSRNLACLSEHSCETKLAMGQGYLHPTL